MNVCPDCQEGKHGACIGTTYVTANEAVYEVVCDCAENEHA